MALRRSSQRLSSGRSSRSSRAARSPAFRPPAPRAVRRPSRSAPPRPPSPRWWPATARWSWASAGSSWATATTPRTPSRPSSSSWPARPAPIRDPDLLGNWLYGVALRTARKARGRLARRRQIEEDAADEPSEAGPAVPADRPAIDREQAEALHAEIDRLPGPSGCRWSSATSRASRSTRRRDGSAARPAPSAAGWPGRGRSSAAASPAAASSCPPPHWPRSSTPGPPRRRSHPPCATSRPGPRSNFAAGQAASPSAAALAREVLRSMLIHKLRFIALTLLAPRRRRHRRGLSDSRPGHEGRARADGRPAPPVAAKPDDANPKPAPGRMFVVGRVLDPDGKPVPGATVMVYAPSLAARRSPHLSRRGPGPDRRRRADASGRFRIDAPRTSSSHHDAFGAVALAPGYGAGWVELDPDDDQPTADIALRPEQVIHGRLFDVQGRPVPGVTLSVASIRRVPPQAAAGLASRFDGVILWADEHQRLSGLAQAGDDRRRGPLHPPRRRPGPACDPHRPSPAVRPPEDRGRDGRRLGIEADDRGAGTGPDPQRPRDLCRHGRAGPSCPARGDGQPGQGRPARRIRDRRRGAVPRESSAGRPHLRRLGLSPGRPALPHRPRSASSGPRGRSSSPSTSPCRAACRSAARSPRRAPASPSPGRSSRTTPGRGSGQPGLR